MNDPNAMNEDELVLALTNAGYWVQDVDNYRFTFIKLQDEDDTPVWGCIGEGDNRLRMLRTAYDAIQRGARI